MVVELQKTIVDMIPKIGSNNTTTTNKVNLNIFLNEHCKDALNLSDFVDNIKLQLEDVLETHNLGSIEDLGIYLHHQWLRTTKITRYLVL